MDEDTARARATEIERLLRTGAQVLAAPDHDERVAAFNDSSIEDILARYAETRTISGQMAGGSDAAGSAGVGSNTFAQVSFVSETSGTMVDLDDPNFWSKMLPEVPALASMDSAAAAAMDAAAIASGAQSLRVAKPDGLTDLDRVLRLNPHERKRLRDEMGGDDEDNEDEAGKSDSRWSGEEVQALCDLILAVGHKEAPQVAIDGGIEEVGDDEGEEDEEVGGEAEGGGKAGTAEAAASSADGAKAGGTAGSGDADDAGGGTSEGEEAGGEAAHREAAHREAATPPDRGLADAVRALDARVDDEKRLRKACDAMLVGWLHHSADEVRAAFLPLTLHTVPAWKVREMGEDKEKKRRVDKAPKSGKQRPFIRSREYVQAAGFHPRPQGRGKSNDQGDTMLWSYQRNCWVNPVEGTTAKGVPAAAGERERVEAEVVAMDAKIHAMTNAEREEREESQREDGGKEDATMDEAGTAGAEGSSAAAAAEVAAEEGNASTSAEGLALEAFNRALPKLRTRLILPLRDAAAWDALVQQTAASATSRLLELARA